MSEKKEVAKRPGFGTITALVGGAVSRCHPRNYFMFDYVETTEMNGQRVAMFKNVKDGMYYLQPETIFLAGQKARQEARTKKPPVKGSVVSADAQALLGLMSPSEKDALLLRLLSRK